MPQSSCNRLWIHSMEKLMEHQGRPVAIVTGGAAGLGFELVRELVERGFIVANIDIDDDAMDKQADAFGFAEPDTYHGFIGDVADEEFARRSLETIADLGPIALLINNAGRPSFKAPTDYTSDDIERCLTGLRGMIVWTTGVLRATDERNVRIVNVMSSAALRGNAHESVYCATKWGERGYTESLKTAYKGSSVKIVGFYPGGIDTNFYTDSRDYVDERTQHSFMKAKELATVLLDNVLNKANLTVADLVVERNY